MSRRLLVQDARTADLPDALPPGTQVLAGTPQASGRELTGDGSVGIWQLTEGTVRDVEADEIFVVLSGRGRIRFDDGEITELQAGTVVELRAGEQTVWTIDEPLRKVYLAR